MKVCQESKCLTADKISLDLSHTRWMMWQHKGSAEDGGGRRWLRQTQSQQFSCPTKSICRLESKTSGGTGFPQEGPTALQVGSKKGDFFCWPSKIKYPAVIYTTFLILSQSQIIAHKPSLLFWFFHETQQLFEVFEITKTSGSFILIFFHIPRTVLVWFRFLQIPRTGSFRLNFSTTWNWCLSKKIKCPPNTGF